MAIRFWRQRQRNAVAPPPAHLGGKEFGIDLVPVRLQEILESNHVRLGHLEDSKAAIQTEFPRLGQVVILCVVLQDEQPRFTGLLVIRVISFWTSTNRSHANTVGVTERNFGSEDGLTVLHLDPR